MIAAFGAAISAGLLFRWVHETVRDGNAARGVVAWVDMAEDDEAFCDPARRWFDDLELIDTSFFHLMPILMAKSTEIDKNHPYRPPQNSPQASGRYRVPLWYRIKRWLIGFIGLAAMGLSGFLLVNVVSRFGLADGWHLMLIATAAFLLGAFAIYTAVRGRWRDIRKFNLLF